MAKIVLTDATISIGGTDLSSHCRKITLDYKAEVQDSTSFGDLARRRLGGLKDWTVSAEFHQDWAASQVDQTLFPLVGTIVAVSIKPTSGAVSATNPNYNGNALLESFPPLGNQVGEIATSEVSLLGDGVLTRSTS